MHNIILILYLILEEGIKIGFFQFSAYSLFNNMFVK